MSKDKAIKYIFLCVIIAAAVLIRNDYIDAPLYGVHHHRMNESAAIARNFAEEEYNIFHPRIDWRGSGAGYIEEAFQAYTFLVATLYKFYGVSESIGRSLSVFFFMCAALALFLLAKNIYNDAAAVFTVLFFVVAPLGIYYSTGFQPDSLTLLLGIVSVGLFKLWTDTSKTYLLLGSACALGVAVMMQPMNLHLGLPMLYLAYTKSGLNLIREWRLWVFALVAIAPAFLWYWYAHQIYLEFGNTNGVWTISWKFRTAEFLSEPDFYREMAKRVIYRMTTLVGLPLLLLGLVIRQADGKYLVHVWLAAVATLILLSPGSHLPHEYYQLPLLTVTSLLMGSAAGNIWNQKFSSTLVSRSVSPRILVLALSLVMVNQAIDAVSRFYKMPGDMVEQAGFASRLEELTGQTDLIALGTAVRHGYEVPDETCCRHRDDSGEYFGHEPIVFYQSHRKGWSLHYEDWTIETLEQLRMKGARYFATNYSEGIAEKSAFIARLTSRYKLIEAEPGWVVFLLEPGSPA